MKADNNVYGTQYHYEDGVSKGYSETGGSLTNRDYIAIKAMQGMLANPDRCGSSMQDDVKYTVEHAYRLADAMIIESEKS